MLRHLLCLGLLLCLATSAHAEDRRPWQAGVAKIIITPEKPMWMSGYAGRDKPATGKLHDLWAKALVIEDPRGKRGVLVTLDLIGLNREISQSICRQLMKKYKLERDGIILSSSHTHTGPVVHSNLNVMFFLNKEEQEAVLEYARLLEKRIVHVVGDAVGKLAPAKLAWNIGTAGFAVNRRNNKEADVPMLREKGLLKGPNDHDVPVLTVTDGRGKLTAIVFGYACHSTVLPFFEWSGDYPGFAQIELEQAHPGAIAMFWAGCGGDQNPLPRRKVELCEKYGNMLAAAVEEALKQPLKTVSPGLRTAFSYVDLAYEKVITRPELENFAAKDANAIRKRWAARMLKKLDAGEKFAAAYPYPLHAWRLGKELLVLGMGAETVVDYSLRFKVEFGPGTWVFGYADDMISYIPSRRVWAEGGYEGGYNLYEYGRPALRWAGDVEDRIATAMKKLVKSVPAE